MERTIRVTGKGKISVKPDTISLIIDANGVFDDYETAVKKSAEETAELRMAVESAGLAPGDLKTSSFDINTEYESFHDRDGNFRRRFVGYKYQHSCSINFPKDNEQLGRLLYALAKSKVNVEFSIRYIVKDPEPVKNELLNKAVSDSQAKANVLAEAAGVSLGNIVTIDYSWGELKIYSEPVYKTLLDEAPAFGSSYDIDIEAEDIDVQDTVTIIWSIAE